MSKLGVTRQITLLVSAFTVVIILAAAALTYASRVLVKGTEQNALAANRRTAAIFSVVEAVSGVEATAKRILREKDPDEVERLIGEMKALQQAARKTIDSAGPGFVEAGEGLKKLGAAYEAVLGKLLVGDIAQAQQAMIESADPAFDGLLETVGRIEKETQRELQSSLAASTNRAGMVEGAVIVGISMVLAALIALSVTLVRRISGGLNSVVHEVREAAEQMASAAGQVSESAQTLSQGASEQAATLEETSASAEQIRAVTRANADGSRNIADLIEQTATIIDLANERVSQMVVSMDEISASSGRISKIIRVIDEIAFQTNILALNAAVEAARAGEAGSGFAVVADEVRNLARRSADAASETATLIEESIGKSAQGGARLADVTGAVKSMTEVSEQVRELVVRISDSSQEQAKGVEGVARALSQMEQETQRTAANAEQSAAAGEQLSAQSEALRSVVRSLSQLVHGG